MSDIIALLKLLSYGHVLLDQFVKNYDVNIIKTEDNETRIEVKILKRTNGEEASNILIVIKDPKLKDLMLESLKLAGIVVD